MKETWPEPDEIDKGDSIDEEEEVDFDSESNENASSSGDAETASDSGQKENPAQAIADEALKDGKLNLSESNSIYRDNASPNLELTVDATKLTVFPRGQVPLNGQINARVLGLEDWLVHGNVKLVSVDGVITIKSELYDFDYKEGITKIPRNFETYIGELVAGDGIPFRINFEGSPSIVKPGRRLR